MSPEVAGDVGVHVTEAVESAQRQVKQEPADDGEDSSKPTPTNLVWEPKNHHQLFYLQIFDQLRFSIILYSSARDNIC